MWTDLGLSVKMLSGWNGPALILELHLPNKIELGDKNSVSVTLLGF